MTSHGLISYFEKGDVTKGMVHENKVDYWAHLLFTGLTTSLPCLRTRTSCRWWRTTTTATGTRGLVTSPPSTPTPLQTQTKPSTSITPYIRSGHLLLNSILMAFFGKVSMTGEDNPFFPPTSFPVLLKGFLSRHDALRALNRLACNLPPELPKM